MRRLAVLLVVSALASCSDNPVAPTPDQRLGDRSPAEASSADRGRSLEARPTDAKPAESKPDAKLVADIGPAADKAVASDAKPGSLQVKVVSAEVWANLMPPAPPDPTSVKLTLSFTNSGGQAVTGIKLADGKLQPVPIGTALPIELQAMAPFAGTVPAGQAVTAEFLRVKSSGSVPLPTTCNGLVKIGFTVQHAAGSVGPLWSSDVSFLCAY
jgi:hypothetical protein